MTTTGGVSAAQLRSVIDRVERLHEERKAIGDDIRDIYAEARGNGFDVKTIQRIVKIRAEDPEKRAESNELLDVYLRALGMLPDFEAAESEGRAA